jgi:hypothetical protein
MAVMPPLRYIHIDDYSPVGIDNGPDDLAFANARADLVAYGYRTLVVGRKQYWLQNGFNLGAYTDFQGIEYPGLTNVLITSDSAIGARVGTNEFYVGLPSTIILSPGFADPTVGVYTGGSEPCRTTASVKLADGCGLTSLRIMSLAAYQFSGFASANIIDPTTLNQFLWNAQRGMAAAVPSANGVLWVPGGGGTAIQIDGDYCYLDDLFVLGFRNVAVCVPQLQSNLVCATTPRIGWLKGQIGNGIRIDYSNNPGTSSAGIIDGPVDQFPALAYDGDNALGISPNNANGLNLPLVNSSSIASDLAGGSLISVDGSHLPTLAVFWNGMPLKITMESGSSIGSNSQTAYSLYNPFNAGNLTPSGLRSNRFDAIVSSTSGTTLVLQLPNMPPSSFFDVSVPSVLGGVTALGTITQGTHGLGVSTLTVTLTGSTTNPIAVGQVVTGSGLIPDTVLPGTVIAAVSSSGTAGGTYTVNVPQITEAEVIGVFSGAVGTAKINNTTLTVNSLTAGTIPMNPVVLGPGVDDGTTITAGTFPTYTVSPSQTLSAETLNFATGSVITGSISSNGTNATLTTASTTLSTGQALFSSALVPGSYVMTGGTGTTFPVGVMQAVGSSTLPVNMMAQTGVVVAASIGSVVGTVATANNTLTVAHAISGSLSPGLPVIGPGVLANTFIAGSGTTQFPVSLSQVVPTTGQPEVMFAPSGTAILASISGTVLSVWANSGTSALSAGQLLSGSGVLPGSSIAGAISTTGSTTGLYALNTAQAVGSSNGTSITSQTFTVIPTAVFQGWISGTTLNIAPAGTLAVGQLISAAGSLSGSTISAGTTISSVSSSSGNITYTVNPPGVSGGPLIETVTAVPTLAMVVASVGANGAPSNVMTISQTLFGTIGVLTTQQVTGPGISGPTYIASGSGSTYTLSSPWLVSPGTVLTISVPSGAQFTGSISSTSLTVSAVSSGVLGIGHAIVGAGISSPIYIASTVGTAAGGVGTYTLTSGGPSTVPSGPMASLPAPTTFTGTLSGTTLTIAATPSLGSGTSLAVPLHGSEVAANTTITGSSTSTAYTVSPAQIVGSPLSPITMTAMPIGSTISSDGKTLTLSSFVASGYLAGPSLIVNGTPGGTLAIGQQVTGYGVAPGSVITSLNGSSGLVAGTYALGVPQSLVGSPMIASNAGSAAAISGSIGGTILTASVIAGTLATGQVISGPGIATGTSITSLSSSGGIFTGTLSVPQYQSALTVSAAGDVIFGSLTGLTLNVVQSSTKTISNIGTNLLSGNGVEPGTNITSTGTSLTNGTYNYPISFPQSAASQSMNFYGAISTTVGSSTLGINLASNLPGRLVELNAADSTMVNAITAFGADTLIKITDSIGVTVNGLGYDSNPPDMTSTVIDLQGGVLRPVFSGAAVIDVFTFLNNQSASNSLSSAGAVSLIGCRASVIVGGTLINDSGGNLVASACGFSGAIVPPVTGTPQGTISYLTPMQASFTTTQFDDGVAFVVGASGGVSASVTYDLSCINAPPP